MEVRPGRVAGGADEADRLARDERGARHDVRIEHREMAVRPDLAVERPEGEADAAARVGGRPRAQHDGVREGVERRAHRRGDVDRRIVVVRVRGGDDPGAAADGEDVAGGVRRAPEELRCRRVRRRMLRPAAAARASADACVGERLSRPDATRAAAASRRAATRPAACLEGQAVGEELLPCGDRLPSCDLLVERTERLPARRPGGRSP